MASLRSYERLPSTLESPREASAMMSRLEMPESRLTLFVPVRVGTDPMTAGPRGRHRAHVDPRRESGGRTARAPGAEDEKLRRAGPSPRKLAVSARTIRTEARVWKRARTDGMQNHVLRDGNAPDQLLQLEVRSTPITCFGSASYALVVVATIFSSSCSLAISTRCGT